MSSEVRVRTDEFSQPVQALRVDAGAHGICLVRIGEVYYALDDRCSHAEVSLSEGDVDPEERCIECWKHGSAFSLLDGTPQSLPATEPVAVFATRVDGDEVVVTLP
jgi:3-phenylpropionate/trans-cinnamate dioxygenase ferredoxin subunit